MSVMHRLRAYHALLASLVEHEDESDGLISEAHELFANLLIGFVGLHVGYLLLFKRPLARFMLFLDRPN